MKTRKAIAAIPVLFAAHLANADVCDDALATLTKDDGIWLAVNDGQYERTFRFTAAAGHVAAEMLPGSLRHRSVTTTTLDSADGKLRIRFTDERGAHVQVYDCSGTSGKFTGYADGPTEMGSYSHSAVMTKLANWTAPSPPRPTTGSSTDEDHW